MRRYFGELAIYSSESSISARKTIGGEGFSIPLYYVCKARNAALQPVPHSLLNFHCALKTRRAARWSRTLASSNGQERQKSGHGSAWDHGGTRRGCRLHPSPCVGRPQLPASAVAQQPNWAVTLVHDSALRTEKSNHESRPVK